MDLDSYVGISIKGGKKKESVVTFLHFFKGGDYVSRFLWFLDRRCLLI